MSVVKGHSRTVNGKTVKVREHSRKGDMMVTKKSMSEKGAVETDEFNMTVKKPKKRRGPIDQKAKRNRVKNKAKLKKAAAKFRRKNRKKIAAKASKRRKMFG